MKTDYNDLLIEIGVEELPPKSLKTLSQAFKEQVAQALTTLQLSFTHVEDFVTPRRLAVRVNHLSSTQPPQNRVKKGPLLSAAFDKQGNPTQAALGFAAACQTTLEDLKRQATDKGECLVYEQTLPGQSVRDLLPKIVQDALRTLPIPKHMRWGELKESFVRPVHWVVLLFGEQVIPAEFFGIPSSRMTQGHRFHHPATIPLNTPSEYEDRLLTIGKVVPNFATRRQLIESGLKKIAAQEKAVASIEPELLDQVTGLVEWPVVLLGQFNEQFLALPQELLISSMRVHQKCFPLLDEQGKLLPKFLIVSNIESTDAAAVIQGNEYVMQARLQDAAFYDQVDKETPLKDRQEDLKKVIFQQGLGSLWDKSHRIKSLAEFIHHRLFGQPNTALEQAALLCKTDLLTQMVGEFPELQGIMGRYYALREGESETVARAIEDHYHPRFAQDTLPATLCGSLLALSDRVDTLVGIFGLGKRPTGDKDPFALRRQALAVLRILIEQELDIDLNQLLLLSKEQYSNLLGTETPIIQPLLEFCFERLRGWYADQGISARTFDAVLAKWPTNPLDFDRRLKAVVAFQDLPEAESLSAANKRVRNLLSKSEVAIPPETLFEDGLLREVSEKQLAKAILEKEQEVAPLLKDKSYTQALKALASLKTPIDQFFDSAMVMVDEIALRDNRLKLLNRLRILFLEVADISLL